MECRSDGDCADDFFCRGGVCLRWSSDLTDPAVDAGSDAAPDATGG